MRWLVLFAVLLSSPAFAQVPMTGAGVGAPASSGGSPTFTNGANVTPFHNNFAAGTVTLSNLNGGVNYPSGAVVVVGVWQDNNATSLGTVTIGGNTASQVTQDTSTKCQLFQATMASSSVDQFAFTGGAAVNNVGVAGAYFTNLASSTKDAVANETYGGGSAPNGGNDPQNFNTGTNPSVTATGFGFAFVGIQFGAALPTALSWTNTTSGSGDTFSSLASQAAVGSSHTATAGTWNPGVSGVTNNMNFLACMAGATYH